MAQDVSDMLSALRYQYGEPEAGAANDAKKKRGQPTPAFFFLWPDDSP
ncbi:hypothetical protein M8R20_41695 [Pseudomonas sp. R2.Fl]|nr:hypothetical protein [Pseudomonas sp. R2.Fl]